MSNNRPFLRLAAAICLLGGLAGGGWWLVRDPSSPLPPAWNPLVPLDVTAAQTWVTGFKLDRALASDATCLAALETGARFTAMPPLSGDGACGIDPRVELRGIGPVEIAPVETTCAVALRLAMWERHALRRAAEPLGSAVARLHHQGSYNCRAIRGGTRLSTHATAEAIDIRAVSLADGRRLELLEGWDGPSSAFWRAARDGACTWFETVLGPDYNDLHADHFHLQSRGWGRCS